MLQSSSTPNRFYRAFGAALLQRGEAIEAERCGGKDPWGRLDRVKAYVALASDLIDAGFLEASHGEMSGVPCFDLAWLQSIAERPDLAETVAPSIRRYLASLTEGRFAYDASVRPTQQMYEAHGAGLMEIAKWHPVC
jgi:hypothetical protein